jgi:hypothetical protein
MQVCVNGHRITDMAMSAPELTKRFCSKCGARTIMRCEQCDAAIPGHYQVSGVAVLTLKGTPVPKFCASCGSAFPWQLAAQQNLIEVLRESEVPPGDVAIIEASLPDIVAETPKSEAASLRVKRILTAMGKPAYDISIKVISDLASETAKKTLGLK